MQGIIDVVEVEVEVELVEVEVEVEVEEVEVVEEVVLVVLIVPSQAQQFRVVPEHAALALQLSTDLVSPAQ